MVFIASFAGPQLASFVIYNCNKVFCHSCFPTITFFSIIEIINSHLGQDSCPITVSFVQIEQHKVSHQSRVPRSNGLSLCSVANEHFTLNLPSFLGFLGKCFLWFVSLLTKIARSRVHPYFVRICLRSCVINLLQEGHFFFVVFETLLEILEVPVAVSFFS